MLRSLGYAGRLGSAHVSRVKQGWCSLHIETPIPLHPWCYLLPTLSASSGCPLVCLLMLPGLPYPPDRSQKGPCSPRKTPCVWSSLSYFKALGLRGNCFPGASQTPHDNTSLADTSPQQSCLQSWGCGLHRSQPVSQHLCYLWKAIPVKISSVWDETNCTVALHSFLSLISSLFLQYLSPKLWFPSFLHGQYDKLSSSRRFIIFNLL